MPHLRPRSQHAEGEPIRHIKAETKRDQFDLLLASRSVQTAKITLPPGGATDDEPSNEHPHSEQWVFILSGSGIVTIGKSRRTLRHVALGAQSLLLIEKGELHQIRNNGKRPLVAITFYAPPAYDAAADPL